MVIWYIFKRPKAVKSIELVFVIYEITPFEDSSYGLHYYYIVSIILFLRKDIGRHPHYHCWYQQPELSFGDGRTDKTCIKLCWTCKYCSGFIFPLTLSSPDCPVGSYKSVKSELFQGFFFILSFFWTPLLGGSSVVLSPMMHLPRNTLLFEIENVSGSEEMCEYAFFLLIRQNILSYAASVKSHDASGQKYSISDWECFW